MSSICIWLANTPHTTLLRMLVQQLDHRKRKLPEFATQARSRCPLPILSLCLCPVACPHNMSTRTCTHPDQNRCWWAKPAPGS
eukprot:4708794-Prorocentrum_lima.AAC.1